RVDKLTYAALEATLQEYLRGRAAETVPVQRMLTQSAASITSRAEALANRLTNATAPVRLRATVIAGESAIGGGSAPGLRLPTTLVAVDIDTVSADTLLARLRTATPPIIARIDADHVVIDLRTVEPEQDEALAHSITRLL